MQRSTPSSQRVALNAEVLNALRHIVRSIRVSSHAAETHLGISGAQLFVLQNLAEHPAASLQEIARRTLTDQSSVSVVVSRLVQRRLVSRRKSREDKRRLELTLTASGRALLRHAPELAHSRLVGALVTTSSAELRAVARVLGKLATAMGANERSPEMFFEKSAAPRRRVSKVS